MNNWRTFLKYYSHTLKIDFEESTDRFHIKNLTPKNKWSSLTVLGMHGSGSTMAIWEINDKRPVVWIDTEGTPTAVIAASVDEFMTLLPYGTGYIYDMIAAWERFLKPEGAKRYFIPRNPSDRFSVAWAKERLSNSDLTEYAAWLKQQGLSIPADPCKVIGEAYKNHPRFRDW